MDIEHGRDEFFDAIASGDARLAELIALEAVTEGMSLATLYVDVITPAMREIGVRWQRGELSIADEHLATSLVAGVMALVGRSATRQPRRSRERVMLAAVENEGHVVGLRMLQDLFEGAGFDVRYLGAAVPVATLEEIVRRHQPVAIGLSASVGAPAQATQRAVEVLAERCPGVVILVGGEGVPNELRRDPRVSYAPDARVAVDLLEGLVESEPDTAAVA